MKILFIAPSLELGGVSRYIIGLSNELERMGHEIFIIKRNNENDMRITNENINILDIEFNEKGIFKMLRNFLKIRKQLNQLLKKEKIDIIIGNTSFSNLMAIITKLECWDKSSIKIFRIVHGIWRREIADNPEAMQVYGSKLFETFLPIFSKMIESYVIKNSDYLVAVSNEIKEYLISTYGEREIQVIPAGVDTEIFSPYPYEKETIRKELGILNITTILFVGVIREVKGLNYLIESSRRIIQKYEVQFLIVGDGPDFPKYQKMIEDLELNDHFILAGRILDALPLYYQASDIFCLPSLSEGLPQTLLEAMSSGLPVVSTDVGGISTSVKDSINGFLISPADADAIVNRIEFLLDNPSIAEQIGHAARDSIIKYYSWRSISERLTQIIERKFRF